MGSPVKDFLLIPRGRVLKPPDSPRRESVRRQITQKLSLAAQKEKKIFLENVPVKRLDFIKRRGHSLKNHGARLVFFKKSFGVFSGPVGFNQGEIIFQKIKMVVFGA